MPQSQTTLEQPCEWNLSENKQVSACSLTNNGTVLLLVNENEEAYLVNLASMLREGPLNIGGRATCGKAFDNLPNTYFFGVESKAPSGGIAHSFKLMSGGTWISKDVAHQD